MRLAHRLTAALLCLGLIAGNGALCAGWAATPEARMACCADGVDCPMHKGRSDESSSKGVFTQAQADACCATSERSQSKPSNPTPVTAISAPILGAGVVLPPMTPTLLSTDGWRTESPIYSPPVPRHVLLSVFLV